MIGPSSSPPAGAVRIKGKSSLVFDDTPTEVEFNYLDSFAKTVVMEPTLSRRWYIRYGYEDDPIPNSLKRDCHISIKIVWTIPEKGNTPSSYATTY